MYVWGEHHAIVKVPRSLPSLRRKTKEKGIMKRHKTTRTLYHQTTVSFVMLLLRLHPSANPRVSLGT